jgi:hypothetical protein
MTNTLYPPTRSLKLFSHPNNRNPQPPLHPQNGHTTEPPPQRRPNYPHVVHAFRYAASHSKHRTNYTNLHKYNTQPMNTSNTRGTTPDYIYIKKVKYHSAKR